MNAKVQDAVVVVQAKWAHLRDLRQQQVQAQKALEDITEKTMEAGARYEEAVEQLARAARVTPDAPLPPPWPGIKDGAPQRLASCAMCGHQIHYTEKYEAWFHSDGRSQCLSSIGTNATPVPDAEKPYGYGLDDEPDGE